MTQKEGVFVWVSGVTARLVNPSRLFLALAWPLSDGPHAANSDGTRSPASILQLVFSWKIVCVPVCNKKGVLLS